MFKIEILVVKLASTLLIVSFAAFLLLLPVPITLTAAEAFAAELWKNFRADEGRSRR